MSVRGKEIVGYCRVSGASQLNGDGFPRQEEAIRLCSERKGFHLIRYYHEEAVPGKLDESYRPAFQEMIADLLSNGCRTVVVEGMHRMAREYRTQEQLIIYLASKEITLISADTDEDITAAMMGDPMRRAMVQIQGIFSELEKNLLVAKLAKARQRKKDKTGKGTGRHAFGEKAEEGVTLRTILSLRGSGMTFETIASHLNQAKLSSRTGAKWRASTVAKIVAREEAKNACKTAA